LIKMADPVRQREFALDIVRRLRAAGFEALWAGGCVRDGLLGLTPKDYDVATNATPGQIRDLFGRRRTLPIGAAFGVVSVLGPRPAGQIDVVTFRSDAEYSDGRHPDRVTFTTAERDAARRDFTINGLFYDPIAEQVVDYVGGQADLEQKRIRAIGDPRLRLHEDRLRMLRAVRFAAAYGFVIEADTFRAIRDMAGEVMSVSAERIGAEIRRMLLDAGRAVALELLHDARLLPHVLPEVARFDAAAFAEAKRTLAELVAPSLPLALAAMLLPADEPAVAGEVGRRLRFTNKELDRATWLLQQIGAVAEAPSLLWPRLQRLLTHEGAAELLALRGAIAGPEDGPLTFCRERLAWPAERLNPPPLVDGGDLIAHGLTPGPKFAELLERVRDAQLNGEIASRGEALSLVDRWQPG
jgi:tRNA nucleotidyltransferase/poly(A) polymerase